MSLYKEAINNLKNYIEQDAIYKENKPQSDFDKFCINHCRDIEIVLNYIEELETEIKSLNMIHEYDMRMIDEVKEKAVKLYEQVEELEKKLQLEQIDTDVGDI